MNAQGRLEASDTDHLPGIIELHLHSALPSPKEKISPSALS
jgi:hypothetical protein